MYVDTDSAAARLSHHTCRLVFFRGVDHLFLEDVFNIATASPSLWRFSNPKTRTFIEDDMHM